MVVTVVVVVATHNLAYGVVACTLLAAMFFANKIAHYLDIASKHDPEYSHRTYYVVGQVFFSSADRFTNAFDLNENLRPSRLIFATPTSWTLVKSSDSIA